MTSHFARNKWVTLWVSTLVVLVGLAFTPGKVAAEPIPPEGNPNYFYDRETAFIINYAIDPTVGGAYTAVAGDGSLVGDLPGNIWGVPMPDAYFAGNPLQGNDRSLFGQGTCIRWFITEYQRASDPDGNGVDGINEVLVAMGRADLQLANARQLLSIYAASCADFVLDYMIIPKTDDGIAEDPYNPFGNPAGSYDLTAGEGPDIGDVRIPNRVFYWTSVGLNSPTETSRYVDDTLHQIAISGAAPRAESIVAWSIAELGNAMAAAGIPGSGRFTTHGQAYWNWFFNDADVMPAYDAAPAGGPDLVDYNACPVAFPPNRCLVGGARDVFVPALGVAIGQAGAAVTYAENYLGTNNFPDLTFPPPDTIQDGAYIAGYGRAVLFANMGANDGNFWDFGNFPALEGAALAGWGDPAAYPSIGAANLAQPFAHFAGRELLSGVQRSFWFYYTFGENPNTNYPPLGTFGDTEDMREAIVGFWDYVNQQMWDQTDGVEAWFESTSGNYKPCFSAGTDLPIGDWRAPAIADKVHIMNPDGSATVEVSGVQDEPFDYMSWQFAGSGVVDVEVVYSIDNGVNWITVDAVDQGGGLWTGDIPALDIEAAEAAGNIVYYYARAMDAFNNWRSFPEGAEERGTNGSISLQSTARSQTIGEEATPTPESNLVVESEGGADLQISKTVNPGVVSIGQDATWTITVSNVGSATANDQTIIDDVPDGLQIISTNADRGTITVSGQQVTWFIPNIDPGETLRATILTRVTQDVQNQIIINEVGGSTAQIVIVSTLPATGERPWWAPCRWFGNCRDDE